MTPTARTLRYLDYGGTVVPAVDIPVSAFGTQAAWTGRPR